MSNVIKTSAEKVVKETVKQPKPKLMNIKLEKLHPFENHPYKVLDDNSMTELIESIKEYGLLNRIIVRPLDESPEEYEIISGHRRVHAAKFLEMKEVPAVIHFIDRDEATVMMVDSNCQRENLTLMEKSRSYRMKADALSHQGKTLGQNVPKSEDNRTTAKIGADSGDSYKTVQRLIRLTYLVPELQEYVDKGKMKMLPAYELSFLDEESQRDIVDNIDETETFPSHAQARRMRKLFEEGTLDYNTVTEIMSEVKPNQVEKLKIPMDDIKKYAPDCSTPKELSDLIIKLMKQNYDRHHNRDAR
ncbi:MAG: ParB/RepB/Spo0J family partition protein [Ruminococcus sp.]|nr:ParB/RepB/Spo0J family partition protein [Ruminococcus sp.]MDY4909264.1 ParB/RepB/Spo0J family partition protein [Candidatus Fimenecus sp.]